MADDFDVVVLGAGSGGYACALRAAQLGLRVALVEKGKVGGTCLHRGCIPTKALLHAAETAETVRHANDVGIAAELGTIDMARVLEYQTSVVTKLYRGLVGLVGSRGIEVIEGAGKLVGPQKVDVSGRILTGKNVVLATGSYARSIPGVEPDGTRILTSDHALGLDRVPSSAVVLGGGVIGVEFASAWRSLGVDVTLVEALPRLLAGEDESNSKVLERAFRRRGIHVRTSTRVASVVTTGEGVSVTVDTDTGSEAIQAELVLVAVGRGPVTEDLGYEQAGVTLDRGFVVTDERLLTSAAGVYAIGDIVPGLQLAHRGFQHGIYVAEHIAGLDPVRVAEENIPRVTYSEPEVASVGLTEVAAIERFGTDLVESLAYDLAGNGRSQILGTTGSVKVVRRKDGPVVGVHLAGSRVGELIGEAQLIVGWEALPEDVAAFVHAHPTQNEALGEAHLALAGKALHVHG